MNFPPPVLLATSVAAFGLALMITPLVRALARKRDLVARPSGERWHSKPTALFGGVAITASAVLATTAVGLIGWPDLTLDISAGTGDTLLALALAGTLMFITGFVDDAWDVSPIAKLVLQLAGGAILVSFGVIYALTPWAAINILFTLFWFVTLTNALNLLDNMDGVCGGVAALIAVVLGALFVGEGNIALALPAFAVAAALAGFLVYNWNPASIFMGDSGSLFVGAVLAGLSAAYSSQAVVEVGMAAAFIPLLLMAIPLLDTGLVIFTRLLAGRPISTGGSDHVSHRLVAMGLSERQTALTFYAGTAAALGLALWLRLHPELSVFLAAGVYILGLIVFATYLAKLHRYEGADATGPTSAFFSRLIYRRRALIVLLDFGVFLIAYYAAFLIRFEGYVPAAQRAILVDNLALVLVAQVAAFGLLDVYRGAWEKATIADVHRIVKATALGMIFIVTAVLLVHGQLALSVSVLFVDAMLVSILAVGLRISSRSLDRLRDRWTPGEPTVVYGAGAGGDLVLRLISATPELGLRPVGFLDDDPNKDGLLIHGLRVLGGLERFSQIARANEFSRVVVGTHKLKRSNYERLCTYCEEHGVELLSLDVRLTQLLAMEADSAGGEPRISDPLPPTLHTTPPAESEPRVLPSVSTGARRGA